MAVLPFVFVHPLCKRVTYWPQVVLGICFNWGMLMAWSDTQNHLPLAAVAMWLGAVLWQVGYDSIYAYVDVRDDRSLGLHSTAMRFGDQGKLWIGGFYRPPWRWAWGGYAIGMSWAYYVGIAAVALHLALAAQGLRHPAPRPQLPPVPRQPVAGRAVDRGRAGGHLDPLSNQHRLKSRPALRRAHCPAPRAAR